MQLEAPASDDDAGTAGRSLAGKTANPQSEAKNNPKTATVRPSRPVVSSASTRPRRQGPAPAPVLALRPPVPQTFSEYLLTTKDPRNELASLSIDEILARPAPPDEPEYMSQQSAARGRGIYWAPLIGGTTMDEKHRIDEELAEARAVGRGHSYRPVKVQGRAGSFLPLDPPGSGTRSRL
jgi:hypothetical protein